MPRPPRSVLAFLGAAAILALLWRGADEAPAATGSLGGLVATALAVAVVGRVVLSLLPAGRPGGHAPGALPVTWAASHALGTLVLTLEGTLLGDVGATVLLTPWVLVAVLRILSLPGGLVPGRRQAHEPAGWPERAAILAATAWLVAVSGRAVAAPAIGTWPQPNPNAWGAVDGLAGLLLANRALRLGHRAPRARAMLLVLLALGHAPLASLGAGAATWLGVAGLVAWLRRADRRGLWLAALGFAGSGALVGLLGLAAVGLGSRPAQRGEARTAAGIGLALLLLGRIVAPDDVLARGGGVAAGLCVLAVLALGAAWSPRERSPAILQR